MSTTSTSSTTPSLSPTTTVYTTKTPTTEKWKVFTVGGNNGDSDVEKIDPMKNETNCITPSKYPVTILGSIAETIGDQSIITCGGNSNLTYITECYQYDQVSARWNLIAPMSERRGYAASVCLLYTSDAADE